MTVTSDGHLATPISAREMAYWKSLPAKQQPEWTDISLAAEVRADLSRCAGLVHPHEVRSLRELLAEAAAGRLLIVQAGDCAEDPIECSPAFLAGKAALLSRLAGVLRARTGTPVVPVGRIAGQFAKPRSKPYETHNGVRLPVFRGLIVNAPEPDETGRRPDPLRMLMCYRAARSAVSYLRRETSIWTSHEALLLDYELGLARRGPDERLLLTSTHWPWIGERTRAPDGAHVGLLAAASNPVACKVGPGIGGAELLELCARLDPERTPGRLTLIARFGAGRAGEWLPGLVRSVRSAGHPVIWMCDPMHANTITTSAGRKTRLMTAVIQEVREFRAAVAEGGGVAGGLHLETTPDPVVECVADDTETARVGEQRYTTLCDPRLNAEQAVRVARAWG